MQTNQRRVGAALMACAGIATVFAFARAQEEDKNAACVSNLKQMSLGLLMYVQDYDEMLPPMKTAAHVQHRIYPYVKNRKIFLCPVTNLPYQPNPALTYKSLASIANPAITMTLHDAKPHPDGLWTVAYLDGHVKRVQSLPAVRKQPGSKKKPGAKKK